jgi:hypothetical protein
MWKNKTVPSEDHFSWRFHPYTGFLGKPSAGGNSSAFLPRASPDSADVGMKSRRSRGCGEKYFRG